MRARVFGVREAAEAADWEGSGAREGLLLVPLQQPDL